jgi:hypothetical protein
MYSNLNSELLPGTGARRSLTNSNSVKIRGFVINKQNWCRSTHQPSNSHTVTDLVYPHPILLFLLPPTPSLLSRLVPDASRRLRVPTFHIFPSAVNVRVTYKSLAYTHC